MKSYLRILVLFLVAAAVLLVFYMFRRATAPESAIIAKEKNRMAAAADKDRMDKDPIYAHDVKEKLQFLDYTLALAYNNENNPDAAIMVLQKLIGDEETKNKAGAPRRSRSYLNEAQYYEALQKSYSLKHDEAGAERARDRWTQIMARAEAAKRQERLEEGKSVGMTDD